jgi:PIN domain nuclease of toxin-antitoxin system
LPVWRVHCLAGALSGGHKDPFDRRFIAQSKEANALLVNGDGVFRHFGVGVLWD